MLSCASCKLMFTDKDEVELHYTENHPEMLQAQKKKNKRKPPTPSLMCGGLFSDTRKNNAVKELLDGRSGDEILNTISKRDFVQLVYSLVDAIKKLHPHSWNDIWSQTLKIHKDEGEPEVDPLFLDEPDPLGDDYNLNDRNPVVVDLEQQGIKDELGVVRKCGRGHNVVRLSEIDIAKHCVEEAGNKNSDLRLAMIFRAEVWKSKNGHDYELVYKQVSHDNFKENVDEDELLLRCLMCPEEKTFKKLQEFQFHAAFKHNDVESKMVLFIQCSMCFKTDFNSEREMLEHYKSNHDNIDLKSKKCGRCYQEFFIISDLVKHVSEVHKGEIKGPYEDKCEVCQEKFTNRKSLKHHIASVHRNRTIHKCEYCTYQCLDRRCLKVHASTVHPRKPHPPPAPKKTKKPIVDVQCDECGKKFNRTQILTRHYETVHQKIKKFTCDVCGVSFYSKYELKVHAPRHKIERPFHCDQCPKTFKSDYSLKGHFRIYHQERNHVCDICGKSYYLIKELNRHIQRMHENPQPQPQPSESNNTAETNRSD